MNRFHSSLLLGLLLVLLAASPTYGQYIFIDTNGDGLCNPDYPSSNMTAVDVWLDSNHNGDGSPATCSDGVNPLDVGLFDIIVHAGPSGAVVFNSFDSQPEGFTILHAFTTEGQDMSVGYSGASYIGPGLIKLGTIHMTATGNPQLSFLMSPPSSSFPSPATGFGSHCAGSNSPNFITLGIDFSDWCGPTITDAVEATTWGKIKQIYR